MSNGFDISKINFGNLPDNFKVEVNLDDISTKTSEGLKKAKIDITDGLDKAEAENLLTELDEDENLVIDDEEITAYANNKGIEGKENEIKLLTQSIIDETGKTTEENKETEEKTADIKVTIQKWGSEPADGNKYANDCLSHIMANNYPDIEPNSKEWQDKELEIMNANPAIYGTVDAEGNVTGARKEVGDTGRHNAVLYENDELILPGIKNEQTTKESDNDKKAEELDETTSGEGVREDNNDGSYSMSYKDENDVLNKKENYDKDGNHISTSEYAYNDDGKLTEIKDTEIKTGKTTVTAFEEDGETIKLKTVTEKTDDGKTITEFDKDDLKLKETELKIDENGNTTEETVSEFDGNGVKTKDTVSKFEIQDGNSVKTSLTQNEYDANGNQITIISLDPNDGTTELAKTTNEYNQDNKAVKTEHYQNGKMTSMTETTYNDAGNFNTVTTHEWDNPDDAVASKTTVRTYNEDGSYSVKTMLGDENGQYTITEYNKDGSIKTEEKRFDENGNEIQ